MHVRRADDGDLDLVTTLRLAFLADHRGVAPDSFAEPFAAATRAFVAEQHATGALLTWLAVDDGDGERAGRGGRETIGLVSMLLRSIPPRPDDLGTVEGYLINLYVPAPLRRRGVGQLLVDACLEHARAGSLRRLVLHFTADGRALYERAGFAPNDRWMELPI